MGCGGVPDRGVWSRLLSTMKNCLIATTCLAVAVTLGVPSRAYSHGEGVIRLASSQVSVGGTIALTGKKLEKNADLRLELRGILDNYPAGRIRTDGKGTVSASITIPPAVWAVIIAIILLSFAAGTFLLSRSKRAVPR